MQHGVGDHPLGRLDAAEQQHGDVGLDLRVSQTGGVEVHRLAELLDRARRLRARRPARAEVGHRGDDRVVPAEHRPGLGAVEAQRVRDRRGGQRPREAAPQLARTVRGELVDQPRRLLLHRVRQPPPHLAQPQRRDERRPVAVVLDAVEREHALAHHLRGREARVVDREGRRVAHRGEREVAAGDEPAVDRRQPRHRLARPEAREQVVGIALEGADGDAGAEWEALGPHGRAHYPSVATCASCRGA